MSAMVIIIVSWQVGCRDREAAKQAEQFASNQSGKLGETIANDRFAVKLVRIEEDVDLRLDSPSNGQVVRNFHFIVANVTSQLLDFDEVVAVVAGGEDKHANSIVAPTKLTPNQSRRVVVRTPRHTVENLEMVMVVLNKNHQPIGNALPFDLSGAHIEQGLWLERLRRDGSTLLGSAKLGEGTISDKPIRTLIVSDKTQGPWNESLGNDRWIAAIDAIFEVPSINLDELHKPRRRYRLTPSEYHVHVIMGNHTNRRLEVSSAVARIYSDDDVFFAKTLLAGLEEGPRQLEPGDSATLRFEVSQEVALCPQRLELTVMSGDDQIGEAVTFFLEGATVKEFGGHGGTRKLPSGTNRIAPVREQQIRNAIFRFGRGDSLLEGEATPLSTSLPFLIKCLKDESAHVRRGAAFLLGEMGPQAASAAGALIEATKDRSDRVRHNAWEALGKVGPAAREAAPALVLASAKAIDSEYTAMLTWCFIKIKHDVADEAVQSLISLVGEARDRRTMLNGVRFLSRCGTAAMPHIARLAEAAPVSSRAIAVVVASRLDEPPGYLERLAADSHPDVKLLASLARARFDEKQASAVTSMARAAYRDLATGKRSSGAMLFVGEILLEVSRRHPEIRADLGAMALEIVRDENASPEAALQCGRILSQLRRTETVPLLIEAAKKCRYAGQMVAILTALDIGPQAGHALAPIVNATTQPSSSVRRAAFEALVGLGIEAQPALTFLKSKVESVDAMVQSWPELSAQERDAVKRDVGVDSLAAAENLRDAYRRAIAEIETCSE